MQIPRIQNFNANSLAKLASMPSSKLSKTIPVECVRALSIEDKELLPLTMDSDDRWQTPIIWYLHDGVDLASKEEAQKLRYRASHYMLTRNVLYKRSHSLLLLWCLNHEEARYVLREVHKGIW